MRRALLIVLATMMVIAGACLLATAGWVYQAFGRDGTTSTSLGEITSAPSSSAVVIDVDATRVSIPLLPVHGTTTIHLESPDHGALLAGAADRSVVDGLIGAREIDAAYRHDGSWNLTHVPGTTTAGTWATPPEWTQTGASLDISLQGGQTLLIANFDGSTGVTVTPSLRFSAPRAPQAALALAISGGVLALGGLALAFSAIWLMRRRADAVVE